MMMVFMENGYIAFSQRMTHCYVVEDLNILLDNNDSDIQCVYGVLYLKQLKMLLHIHKIFQ